MPLKKKISKMNISKNFDKVRFFLLSKDNLINIFLVAIIFLSDRISKIKIIDHQLNNNKIYINDFINFDLVWNTGIGFGIFSSTSNLMYHSITGIIGMVIIFIIYLIRKSKFIDKILFTMILGGALGNFYDRVAYSAVPDFIDIHYQNFHWFTFNIADIFITAGIIMLLVKELFIKNEKN